MRWAITVAIGLVLASVVVFELTMHPTNADRIKLAAAVVGAGLLGFALRWLLDRIGTRVRSLPMLLGVPAVGALLVVAAAVALAAAGMVLDAPQLPVVFVAIGLGAGLGILAAAAVARRAVDDLTRVIDVARGVGRGDLGRRTGVTRADEIGELARAVDAMVERLEAAEQARAADDAARREFLAAVGHDLRTPLAAIAAAAEALIDGVASDPDEYLEAIGTHTATMERLVDDVTTLTSFEAGSVDLAPVDFAEVMDEVAEAMEPLAAAADVKLVVHAGSALPATADAFAIGRLLRNLIQNGIDQAPGVTRIELTGATVDTDVRIRVADDGPGFPDELGDRAFERFVTGDPSRADAGFGLGLAIARSVADAHGGAITLGSGPGGVVDVRIPAHPARPAAP